MKVVDLLSSLAKKDIHLWLDGGNLRFNAPEGVFTAEIRQQVVDNKAAIIEFLSQAKQLSESPITPIERRGEPLAVSYGQQRLWVIDQITPNDVTYNMSTALIISGPLDVALLEQVFLTLVQRHESLRTAFIESDGEPKQVIQDPSGWQLGFEDLTVLSEDERTQAIDKAIQHESLTPYDLTQGYLFRARVLKQSADQHLLVAGMHHIVSDAWSMEVLIKELGILYLAYAKGSPSPLPELPIQYADYAAWQREHMASQAMAEHLEYWQTNLADAPKVLGFPTDRPRQNLPTSNGAVKSLSLSRTLGAKVTKICSQLDITPFMFFLGGWQLLVGRYAKSQDVVMGSPVAGRSRHEIEELIGFFVNILLMRIDLSGEPTIKDYYARVKSMVLGAFSHQDLPIDRLMEALNLERQPGYPPLAEIAFQLINMQEMGDENPLAASGLTLESLPTAQVSARMDMVLAIAKTGDLYEASIEYNTDLFYDHSIELLLEQYARVMEQLAGNIEQPITAVKLYSDQEILLQMGVANDQFRLQTLNASQRAILTKASTSKDYRAFQSSVYVNLAGDIDLDKLNQVLNQVLKAHPQAQMSIGQNLLRGIDPAFCLVPLQPQAQWELVQESNLAEFVGEPLALSAAQPLVRFYCLQGENSFCLLVNAHLLALDVDSQSQLLQSIVTQYQGLPNALTPVSALLDEPAALNQWQQQLVDVAPLTFSPAAERIAVELESVGPAGDHRSTIKLDHRQLATVQEFCDQHELTVEQYFKGLYAILLQRYCQPDSDFFVLEAVHARPVNQVAAVGCFIGYGFTKFSASLWQQSKPIVAWLKAKTELTNSPALISLAEYEALCGHWPIKFVYDYHVIDSLAHGEYCVPVLPKSEAQVHLLVNEFVDRVELSLAYDPQAFNGLSFLQRLIHINEQLLFEELHSAAELSLLSAGEMNQLAQWGNQSSGFEPWDIGIRFESMADSHAQQVALIYGHERLTYQQVNQRVNQLAHQLLKQGIKPGQRVAICCGRSIEFVESVLACVKVGATYVAIDPAYPKSRIDFMIEDCDASIVLSLSQYQESLDKVAAASIFYLDQNRSLLEQQATNNPAITIDGQCAIYAIYTSGSTGQPKGALVTRNAEVNLQQWYLDALELTDQDATLLISAVGFDLTQKNLFAPLLVGGRLVLPDSELFDAEELVSIIESEQITWLNCAPSAFYPMVETAAEEGFQRLASLRYVVLGGEPIRLAAVSPWLSSQQCHGQLVNSYGPTECTDVVLYHKAETLELEQQGLPIGKPVPNANIQIVDSRMQPVIPGTIGEIIVGGVPVGLGYINRDALNKETFISLQGHQGRWYRTGDLARFLPSGDIEYIGRKDFQVKLRGLRIELGEIEFALQKLHNVDDSLVTVHNDQLVAYVLIPQHNLESDWQAQLRNFLPEHMVPSLVIPVQSWPLTPNGKIDRKALPDPESKLESEAPFVSPRNQTEAELLAIWQQVLTGKPISVLDDLFHIGGNSIVATRIVARIRKQWDVPLSVREIFLAPTIADLALAVDRAQQNKNLPPLTRVDRSQTLPLSFVQQQLWLLDQLDPGTSAYNMPIALKIQGKLNLAHFRAAFELIIQRHETLRSNFVAEQGEPRVVIRTDSPLCLEIKNLTGLSETEQESAIRKLARTQSNTGFDLARDPLLRLTLVQLDDSNQQRETLLLGAMHHMVSDGWSLDLIMAELLEAYSALSHGRSPRLPELPVQYVDVAAWQRQWLVGDVLAAHLAYWRDQLDNEGQVLQLPTDFARPPVLTSHGAAHTAKLDASVVKAAKSIARQEGATLFMVLMAAYQFLLSRYSGQNWINVGTPIAGRDQVETENLIGFFINTVVISTELEPHWTVVELLRQVRETTFAAYAHQALPFEKIVEELRPPRDPSRTPFFQVFLNLLNLPPQHQVDSDLRFEAFVPEEHEIHSKYEMNLYVTEEPDDSLSLLMVYNADLYKAASIKRFVDDFCEVLKQMVALPQQPLDLLRFTRNNDRNYLPDPIEPLVKGSYPSPVDLFLQQAERNPNARAIISGDQEISYATLAAASTRIAHQLVVEQGLPIGSVIGIYGQRRPELIAAMLGVLRAGCQFTVLDSGYPTERLQSILAQSKPALLLIASDLVDEALFTGLATIDLLSLFSLQSEPQSMAEDRHDPAFNAYIAFTSGSSGLPKGVVGTFEPVSHFVNWYCRSYQITANDRFSLFSGLAHDPLLRDIFVPLSVGAELHIPAPDWLTDAQATVSWIQAKEISFVHITPSMAQVFINSAADREITSVRFIGLGGDKLSKTVVEGLRALMPGTTIANFYGATETPQVMAVYEVPNELEQLPAVMPLGQGIDQVQILVLSSSGELCHIGEVGEIVVRTPHLAKGYWQEAEDARFTHNPHTQDPRDRVYYTGDRGRYNLNGDVEYLGRNDNQLKIRGYRIEPAEIEVVIRRQAMVKNAVVVLGTDPRGDDCLVAYVETQAEHGEADLSSMRSALRAELPEYMVPALLIEVAAIPLTPNGKIDRRHLPDPKDFWSSKVYVAPETDTEQTIATIWAEVLKLDTISIEDNFFDVGGHSLLAVQIVTRVKDRYNIEFSMRRLLELATIKGMASYVDNALWLRGSASESDNSDDDDLEEFEI